MNDMLVQFLMQVPQGTVRKPWTDVVLEVIVVPFVNHTAMRLAVIERVSPTGFQPVGIANVRGVQ